jgi:hypothetical protein
MSDQDSALKSFVEMARRRGASYQETRQRLLQAGWQAQMVDDLLPRLYVEAEGLAPSPTQGQAVAPPAAQPTEEPTATPPSRTSPTRTRSGIDVWVSTGWRMVSEDFWTFAGAAALAGFLCLFIVPAPPLIVGLNRMLLRKYDGHAVSVGDIFQGFAYFGSAWGYALIPAVPWFLLILLANMVTGGNGLQSGETNALSVTSMILLGTAELALLFAGPFLMIGFAFIADDRGGPVEALAASWDAAKANFINYLLALLVFQLMVLIGYCLCLIGLLFTVPLAHGGVVAMYRSRFPTRR